MYLSSITWNRGAYLNEVNTMSFFLCAFVHFGLQQTSNRKCRIHSRCFHLLSYLLQQQLLYYAMLQILCEFQILLVQGEKETVSSKHFYYLDIAICFNGSTETKKTAGHIWPAGLEFESCGFVSGIHIKFYFKMHKCLRNVNGRAVQMAYSLIRPINVCIKHAHKPAVLYIYIYIGLTGSHLNNYDTIFTSSWWDQKVKVSNFYFTGTVALGLMEFYQ